MSQKSEHSIASIFAIYSNGIQTSERELAAFRAEERSKTISNLKESLQASIRATWSLGAPTTGVFDFLELK